MSTISTRGEMEKVRRRRGKSRKEQGFALCPFEKGRERMKREKKRTSHPSLLGEFHATTHVWIRKNMKMPQAPLASDPEVCIPTIHTNTLLACVRITLTGKKTEKMTS